MEIQRIKITFSPFELQEAQLAVANVLEQVPIYDGRLSFHEVAMYRSMLSDLQKKLSKVKTSCKLPYHLVTALEKALVEHDTLYVQTLILQIQPNLFKR